MKNIRVFVSEKFQFLEMKFSIYLNRRVIVMDMQFLSNHMQEAEFFFFFFFFFFLTNILMFFV